jgi:hypothetical protein
MPQPVIIDASELVPETYRVVNVRKLYTPDMEPMQIKVVLEVEVNGSTESVTLIIEPGTLAKMGYENPTEAFNNGFNQIPDLEYGEPVLQGVQDWMFGFTNPNELTRLIVDAVI